MNKSIEFLNQYLNINNTIVCACSGGPDSMVLINLLIDLKEKYNLKIICAHVNHSLREESKEEFDFVKKFCNDKKIIFEGTIFTNYDGNIESNARKQRYLFFEKIVNKYNAQFLLTAHHGDDLIETILMKIARGSSLDGYRGFDSVLEKKDYRILRPLIIYTKKDIEQYAKINKIEYRIDKTNFDKKYTRNRYRLDILPLLKKEDDNIHLKYLKFSNEIKQANNFINNYVEKVYNKIVNDNKINIDLLKDEDNFIKEKIIYKYLIMIYKNSINYIEKKHIDSVLNLLKTNKPNLTINLPLNVEIVKNYNIISLKKDYNKEDYKFELKECNIVPNGKIKIVKKTSLTNNYVCFLNSKEIKFPLYIRNRKNGDYIELLGLNKRKKVKDIFIDNKLQLEKRNNHPIVVDSNDNILWIPGIKKSKYDNIKTGKYDIILRYDEEDKNE